MALRRVDQVLFGYRDGHELIASSRPLEARTQARLLPHVDASFSGEAKHFLVGVDMESIDAYLLARIWPAPEAPRPGAVWTHGLLLDRDVMSEEHIAGLLSLFRRPSGS